MSYRSTTGVVAVFVLGLCLWLGNTAVSAQSQADSKYIPARPVYLDIHPVADAQAFLSEDLVTAMVQQQLSTEHQSVIQTKGDTLPTSVRVLRVFYIVHKQPTSDGVVMAATAKIDLLRTAKDRHNTVLATSIYSGVQQSLAQGSDLDAVKKRTRIAFKKQLDKRIHQAFTKSAAQ